MKRHLMLGGALCALLSAAPLLALAAETAPAAAAALPNASEADANEVDAVIVLGQGQSRQVQTINTTQIEVLAAGSSPLRAVEKLPGVSFQSADAFGAYEWSTRVAIRGFDQSRLGFTLDGVPLGDMSYGNYNGLHVSRAVTSEDLGKVELAQGAGSLSTASTSNLGGTLQFFTRDPSREFHVQTNATVGSDNMHRVFGRLDTGAIEGLGGLRGYVSAVDQKADKWKGGSEQKQRQYDAKLVLPLGETGSLTAFWNHSERREQDYQDMSFDMIKRLGRDWDNFQPDWNKATGVGAVLNNPAYYAGPNPILSGGYWTGVGTNPYAQYGVATPDDAYYAGAGIRDDDLYAVALKHDLGETARFDLTGYGHKNQGQGLWYTPYTVSPGYGTAGSTAAPLSIRTTEYDIDRKGLIGNVYVDLGGHAISAGFWTEDNDFHQARRFYAETLAAPSRDPLDFQSNPFFTQWEYKFNTKTTTGYIQDVWTINDALKVNFGFKALKVENEVTSVVGAVNGKIQSEDSFLPQVGVVYNFNNGIELFGGYTENMAAFVSAATSGPFASQNQSVVNYIRDNLEPETSKTFESGVRYKTDRFQGVAAFYHVDFENRLDSASTAPPILGLPAVLSNVGSVKTQGVELAGQFLMTDAWSVYGSYAYNGSTYQDDVPGAGGAVAMHTKDKDVIYTPEHLFKAVLSYDKGTGVFANLGVSYTSSRWYTFENNGGHVEGFTVADLTLGYRFDGETNAWLRGLDIQANITNLTDEDYISTVGSGGAAKADPTGQAMTLLPGAPRQAYLTIRKQF
ncbi:TonB-dependent receptor [Caulobacter sp. Root1455]|uniref:TonB-dependent receptor n=1 Tax=unclassified Caulobacter TaxID=2648921 RepID=UPI0006F9A4ED|nr:MULTISPECIES: TonB-dependent receptor [unclassified Caulobacter]KQY27512.1 TonB-dependent receptor [Caulobacter sp. Root487D2Y]KQY92889.1 TonB-dependent receptor [Caulobacter sp. Root1455]